MTDVAARDDGEPTSASIEQFGYRQELKRSLSLFHLVVYGLVFITPGAPISTFGIVYNSSAGMVPLVYVAALVAMLFTALSYMQMSRLYPIAGSVYAYAGRTLGEFPGFIAGWAVLLDYLLFPTLNYVSLAIAVHAIAPVIPGWLCVVVLLIANTGVSLLGIETTARMSIIGLVLVLTLLAIFLGAAALALMHGTAGAHLSITPFFDASKFSPSLIFGALSIAVVSFLGFDAISTLAEETKGGVKVVGRGTLIALCVVGSLFIIQTYAASLFVLGRERFPPGDPTFAAFFDIAAIIGGDWLKVLVSVVGAFFAGMPSALAAQVATGRLLFSMARDGRVPRALAHVHPKRKVPDRALLLVSAVTLILGLTLVTRLDLLTSIISFGALIGFLLLHVSVIVHRARQKEGQRGWLHFFVPTVGFLLIGYVLVTIDTNAKIIGLFWIVIGVAVLAIRKLSGKPSVISLQSSSGVGGR